MAAMQNKRRRRQETCCNNNRILVMMTVWIGIVFVACLFGWSRAISQLLPVALTTTHSTSGVTIINDNADIGSTGGSGAHNDASLQQQQQQLSQLLLDTAKAKAKAALARGIATIHDFRRPPPKEVLLSSPQRGTTITADVRGNLGPPEVMIMDGNASEDWIKDRWQAASDMHGTAIKGSHWVRLHFTTTATTTTPLPLRLGQITRIVLDWETAYAQDYRIDALYRNATVACLYDYAVAEQYQSRVSSRSYGQSPGVKQKLPLHVIHEISIIPQQPQQHQQGIDELLLTIRKPFHDGWGVSLWKIQVHGLDHYNNAAATAADQTTAIA